MAAGPEMTIPDLARSVPGGRVSVLAPQWLTATYYDTTDLRLARWGVTLRQRSERPAAAAESTAVSSWTLKLPTGESQGGDARPENGLARREIEVGGGGTRVPPALARLVEGLTRSSPLVAVACLRTDRARYELFDAGAVRVVEVDDDRVSVLVARSDGGGRRVARQFREVEAELADGGDPAVLRSVVACLRASGAGPPDPTPKLVRALGPRALEPPDVVARPLGPHSTVADVAIAGLATGVARLLLVDPGVRLGEDAEEVRRARVATCRMRSVLDTFRPAVEASWARGLEGELGWLADLLVEARDADVLLERLRGHAAALPAADGEAATPLLGALARARAAARQTMIDAMSSRRYVELLDRLVAAATPSLTRLEGGGEHDRGGRPSAPASPTSADDP